MNNQKISLVVIIGMILLFSNLQLAESELWDLLINLKLEQNPLQEGETPIVIGTVTDHAGKPVSDAEIKVRAGQNSAIVTTDESGSFKVEFNEFNEIPGNYIVNVLATDANDRIGLKKIDFQVKGALSVSAHTEKILSTSEAKRFLYANAEDFENDPIGLKLYNHYQELQEKLREEQALQEEVEAEQQFIKEQRKISIELRKQAINEEKPSVGTWTGWKYDRFVSNLDRSVKDIIVNQLNHTVTVFKEAQKAADEVLANGGTFKEARQAYYEKAAMTRELMEMMTKINNTETSLDYENSTKTTISEFNANSTEYVSEEFETSFTLNVNGTNVSVGKSGSVIYLSVNGTIIELIVNGTQASQSTNSTQN